MITESMIKIDGLTHRFGETLALDGISFEVGSGEVLGLLGPNGAGKTTAINILSTLLVPAGGRASVAGHDVVAEPAAVREVIALTGQFAALDDMLTGRENLVMFGRLRSLPKAEARRRADELLERFELAEAADKRVATYSGGMRRRLDLAASLVVHAPVLFLDEPTTGLDPRSRAEVWQVIRQLRDDGQTIVLTTQYLEEADQLADNAGRVLAHTELLQRVWGPAHSGRTGAVRSVIKNLRHKLGDDAEDPTYIFNEPRVGYRMHKAEQTTEE